MSSKSIRPLTPARGAEGEGSLLTTQAVELERIGKDGYRKIAESNDHGPSEAKKVPQAGLKNYFRVFTYATKYDFILIVICCFCSIGAGVAMPLMNVVFGQLVGSFTSYFTPGTTVTRDEFQAEINRLALLLLYLFIAKFVMSYLSMVSCQSPTHCLCDADFFMQLTVRISGLRMSAALRLAYLRALFAQSVSVIDTISPGKVATRITTSSNTVQLAISQHFAMLFQSLAVRSFPTNFLGDAH